MRQQTIETIFSWVASKRKKNKDIRKTVTYTKTGKERKPVTSIKVNNPIQHGRPKEEQRRERALLEA